LLSNSKILNQVSCIKLLTTYHLFLLFIPISFWCETTATLKTQMLSVGSLIPHGIRLPALQFIQGCFSHQKFSRHKNASKAQNTPLYASSYPVCRLNPLTSFKNAPRCSVCVLEDNRSVKRSYPSSKPGICFFAVI